MQQQHSASSLFACSGAMHGYGISRSGCTRAAGTQGVARLAAASIDQLRSHMGRRWLRLAGEAAGAGAFAVTAWLIRVRLTAALSPVPCRCDVLARRWRRPAGTSREQKHKHAASTHFLCTWQRVVAEA